LGKIQPKAENPTDRLIAIALEGAIVQSIVTDDPTLLGVDVLLIDYDTEGADRTHYIAQRSPAGEPDGFSECAAGDSIQRASGLALGETWVEFLAIEKEHKEPTE
jgi:hypothetical protein